jgi:hypothetical protein
MYRRPKFLEILLEIRQQMAHEADYDVDLFAEIARSGKRPTAERRRSRLRDVPDDEAVKPQPVPKRPRPVNK